MSRITVITTALLAALTVPAFAEAPAFLPLQGYLTDDSGAPVDGETTFELAIYAGATGGTALYSETQAVLVERGSYHVDVGANGQLDLSMFRDQPALFLGISVDGESEMSPRLVIGTTPWAGFAQHAGDSATVGGRAASELRLEANPVPWADLSGVPADIADGDGDALGRIQCSDGAIVKRAGGAWACGVDESLNETEVDGFVANNGYITGAGLAAVATSGQFSDLLGVPAGLADGDSDTLAGLSCSATQIAEWDGTAWRCSSGGGGDTLAGLPCSGGQIAVRTAMGWACADDADTLGNLSCGEGEVAQLGASGWACTAAALSALDCQAQEIPTWDGTAWGCSSSSLNALSCGGGQIAVASSGTWSCSDASLSALVCAAGQVAAWDGSTWGCTSSSLVNLACSTNQLALWNGAAWVCADVPDTLAALPCSAGQHPVWNGTSWGCGSDTVAALTCVNGQVARFDGVNWGCSGDALSALGCGASQIPRFDGAVWGCAADADSGGDITEVTAQAGLQGGGTTGALSLSVDPTYVQRRVGSCPAGSSIQTIAEDGTVTCETDDAGITGTGSAGALARFDGAASVAAGQTTEDGSGNVSVTGTLHSAGRLSTDGEVQIGASSCTNNDALWFDCNTTVESMVWDDGQARFELSDDIAVNGAIIAGAGGLDSDHSRIGAGTPSSGDVTNTDDFFVTADMEVEQNLYLSGRIYMEGSSASGAAADQWIYFYDTSRTSERFGWDESESTFRITAPLQLEDSVEEIQSDTGRDIELIADQDVEVMIDGANNGTVDWWRLYHDGDFLSAGLLAEFREDGELRIRGTLAQSYAFDLAEMFLAEQPVAPGDVVAVGLRADGVVPASVEHGGRVIGVVSTEPGLLLGGAFLDPSVLEQWGPRVVAEFAERRVELERAILADDREFAAKLEAQPEHERFELQDDLRTRALQRFAESRFAPVALAGRVPVRVDARFGAIAVGDRLAASPIAGVAMRADGVAPEIGVALEAHDRGEGLVRVLVGTSSARSDDALRAELAGLRAEKAALEVTTAYEIGQLRKALNELAGRVSALEQ